MIKKLFHYLNHFSVRNLISILSLLIVLTGIFVFLNKTPKGASATWYNSTWSFRQAVSVGNVSGSTLTNEDVLLTIDTSTLISSSKLQSSCQDMRFIDSDDSTPLTYWIEGGCNTTTTQVWINIPSLPNGGKTIYMYYGNSSASDGQASWTGNFTLLYNNTCPSGWTRNSNFDNLFPQGSSSVGITGGSDTHQHGSWSGNTGSGGDSVPRLINGSTSVQSSGSHTHTVTIDTTSSTILPPYLNMIFCQKASLDINSGLIGLFSSTTPSGWTRFSALDNYFPRGSTSYGGTGGVSTHHHTTISTTTGSGSTTGTVTGSGTGVASAEYHNVPAQDTADANNIPPYLNMIYASANSNTIGTTGIISLSDAIPPLGWTHFSALDNNFPQGSSSYGGTGGTTTHNHSVSITTDISTSIQAPTNNRRRSNVHSHSISFTTDNQSDLPPFYTILFIQKKTSQSASFNTEQGLTSPTDLLTENLVNPSNITTLTPKFSAIFHDYDVGNSGAYYQIEVNTTSDFTGTSMWDSTQTAMTQIADNVRSQDITYAGTGLAFDGQTYYWRIKFWDQANIAGNWSATAEFTMKTNATSSDPVINCFVENASDNSSLNIIWQDNTSSEINFEVQKSVNGGAWTVLSSSIPIDTTSYLDSSVSNGNTYIYQIAPIFSGPTYGPWCLTPMLTLGSGSLQIDSLQLDGIQIN